MMPEKNNGVFVKVVMPEQKIGEYVLKEGGLIELYRIGKEMIAKDMYGHTQALFADMDKKQRVKALREIKKRHPAWQELIKMEYLLQIAEDVGEENNWKTHALRPLYYSLSQKYDGPFCIKDAMLLKGAMEKRMSLWNNEFNGRIYRVCAHRWGNLNTFSFKHNSLVYAIVKDGDIKIKEGDVVVGSLEYKQRTYSLKTERVLKEGVDYLLCRTEERANFSSIRVEGQWIGSHHLKRDIDSCLMQVSVARDREETQYTYKVLISLRLSKDGKDIVLCSPPLCQKIEKGQYSIICSSAT